MTTDSELLKILKSPLKFASHQDEEEIFHQDDLIQLFPFGLSLNTESSRPFLLLKDATHEHTLPVALNPLEAGMSLAQSSPQNEHTTPHRFTLMLMESLGFEPLQCVFVQIKGAHQYVRVYFRGHPGINSMKLRADEAMSLALAMKIPIYATKSFIARSKLLTAEIEGMGKGLRAHPEAQKRTHTYLQ